MKYLRLCILMVVIYCYLKRKIDKVALHPKPQKLNELRGRL